MPRERDRTPFVNFGTDIKEARKVLGYSQRAFAEEIGIDPRYLANIENSGSLPSLPIFHKIITLCQIPVERYFYPEAIKVWESKERANVTLKVHLCPDEYLPVIEGALDAAIYTGKK
jgi:transcriptional regulator with XRE-family HTH domain